jgi:predicted phosphodiesterase
MLLGDTHGKTAELKGPLRRAKKDGVEAIVQVGDFGFIWRDDNRLDRVVNFRSQIYEVPIYFLDGNHEDHDRMEEMNATHDAERFVEVANNIFYLPRGFAWEWDGVRFMSVGGAVSTDVEPSFGWPGRTLGFDWFPQERISYRDVDRAISKGKVDVLLSHDVAEIPPVLGEKLQRMDFRLDRETRSNRMALRAIAEEVQPKLMVHGHYHYRYNDLLLGAVVSGLGMNGSGQSQYVVIDTDRLDEQIAEARARIEARSLTRGGS